MALAFAALIGCTAYPRDSFEFPDPSIDTVTDGVWRGERPAVGIVRGRWVAYGGNCEGWRLIEPTRAGAVSSGPLRLSAWGCGDPLVAMRVVLED
jgi:hypothetical protein